MGIFKKKSDADGKGDGESDIETGTPRSRNRGGDDDGGGASSDEDTAGGFKARASKFGTRIKDKIGDGIDTLPEPWQRKLQAMALEAEEMKEKVKEMADKQAEIVRIKVAEKVNDVLDRALTKAGRVLAGKVKEDSMPVFVQDGIDATIEDLMPDVKQEIMESVEAKIRKIQEPDQGTPPKNPYTMLRAWTLYTLYPCDKTIWDKLRNPFWYLFVLIMAFPYYGVHQSIFILLLIFRDKSDEFQLVDYIVGFKGMQFLAIGVIPSINGAFQMYFCSTSSDLTACTDDSPGLDFWQLMFFAAQILLMWGAFALLPYAEKRGGKQFKHHRMMGRFDSEPTPGCCGKNKYKNRGGRLARWVFYDTFCFVIAVLLIAVAIFTDRVEFDDDEPNYWKTRATFFWTRVLYGLLSFPWMLFKLPFVFTLFTHARPTGYNRNGKTMPLKKLKNRIVTQAIEDAAGV